MEPDLKRQNQQLTALYAIALDLLNHHAIEDVFNRIVLHISEILEAPFTNLGLLDGSDMVIQATTEFGQSLKGSRVPLRDSHLSLRAIETGQPQFLDNYINSPTRIKLYDSLSIRSAGSVPVFINGQIVGALAVGRVLPDKPFGEEDVAILNALAELAAVAIKRANLFEDTQKQSLTDSLTQLANRRQFDIVLAREWRQAVNDSTPLALIMIDIDFFKDYNDAYGHAKGDECLKQVAAVIAQEKGFSARYGGEEFALIYPRTEVSVAQAKAESLRQQVAALQIPHHLANTSYVTISLGVVSVTPLRSEEPVTLIIKADQALYEAKDRGKNCVCVFNL